MNDRVQRTIYLITYSRADLECFNTRQSVANAICSAFETVTTSKAVQWVVCREEHEESTSENDKYHYHMAVKLNKKSRWVAVRNYLDRHHHMKVHFSDTHTNYYSAYSYCLKEDTEPLHSDGHPNLESEEAPRTSEANHSRKAKAAGKRAKAKRSTKKGKVKRLSVYDVTRVIRKNNIKSRLELIALATSQEKEGKTNLIEFIANRGYKIVDDALNVAWEFADAHEALTRSKMTRVEILQQQFNSSCVQGCNKKWLECAVDLLQRNSIDINFYCNAFYNALKQGRGKYRNIYIYGRSNCGKSFMIAPLKEVYKAFVNPATGTFAWVGAEKAEVILLNDFRWNASIIAWSDLLQMLEGDTMHLPAPKNFVQKDLVFDRDTPFFATADQPLLYIKSGVIDHVNSEMMRVRWNHFNFTAQIPQEQQRALPPCGRCFAELILSNKNVE